MRLLRIDRKDLVPQTTSKAIRKDIARRDAAIVHDEKRQQDGKRTSSYQDQPEAEISPVSTEQDDPTAPPPTDEPAAPAEPTEKDKRPT
jgi:hypothetical protein